MGAMLWFHETPWQPDARAALHRLQSEIFQSKYDFATEFERWHRETKSMLRAEQESGDRYGLVDVYSQSLKEFDELAAQPAPTEPIQQLAVLRRVINAGEGFSSALDVTDVNPTGDFQVARLLSPADVAQFIGAERPTQNDVMKSIGAPHGITERLDRGESFAFPIHDKAGVPTHWFFIGNSVD